MTPEQLLVLNKVTKTVTTVDGLLPILKPVSFTVNTGESVAITGPSGAGKSTLLGLLAGLDSPTTGEIVLDHQPLHKMDEDQRASLRRQSVGFIFQSFMLVQSLSALENVMLAAQLGDVVQPKKVAEEWLEKVGLSHRASHYPNQLSGGEQQRVAIARAFVTQPRILFADEPTGNLDHGNGQRIIDLLFDLNKSQHSTLILVTHDLNLANHCQRQFAVNDGVVEEVVRVNHKDNVIPMKGTAPC